MKAYLVSLFLGITAGTLPLARAQSNIAPPASIPAQILQTNAFKELLLGPEEPDNTAAWLAGMLAYREENRPRVQPPETGDPYAASALLWVQRGFIQPLMMAHERYFYDPGSRRYTVSHYLGDLRHRYGGIDSVLIWPTYPNIGIDNRNQFDLWRDMPGGLAGLHNVVSDFQAAGVHVLIPIMIWDTGTRDEGVPMPQALAELAKTIGADGFNGDTMSPVTREFYSEPMKIGHPMAIEPEVGLGDHLEALGWNVLSWGYWWPYQSQPGVDRYKWIEPRHLTHVCDRWAHDRTDMLQYAFFNGDGYVSWENIWGIWNQFTDRDANALRRISAIYRAFPDLLVSAQYEPFVRTVQSGVFATKFPGDGETLWTLINRNDSLVSGVQIEVPATRDTHFYDLWRGKELHPELLGTSAHLAFDLDARGYGAILTTPTPPDKALKRVLSAMQWLARVPWKQPDTTWKELPQQIVEIPRTRAATNAPEGMVVVPAASYEFAVEGVMIEKSEGVDVQYPWEDKPTLQHRHTLLMKTFYIDRAPVTCTEFKRFLDATLYHPKDAHNFLRDWKNGTYPQGWDRKPVTWVSLEDARAYAKWAGKRLPHEWEWQYAAQANDDRLYPWGNEKDNNRVPPFENGREQRPPTDVDAFPQGASPFGVLDLVGNVWQWTDEFQDQHTRAAILKGGSYYRPDKSGWYFPQARQLNQHGKYLLMAPSLDRSATIGFRCVVDAE
jgi:formylglycine-generating enzyme required for sulfatase activity